MVRSRFLVLGFAALAAGAFSMWTQMTGLAWTDYDFEVAGPMATLLGGDLAGFLSTAPGYGGSLLLRAPFAFVVDALGGGEEAVYLVLAVPCLLAAMAFGLVLVRLRDRALGNGGWALAFVVLAAGNPVSLNALDIGHPEELLGAAACVGAVLAALSGRGALVAVLLGLAIANKLWAVMAVPVVFVALPRHQVRVIFGAALIAAPFVIPFMIPGVGGGPGGIVASSTSTNTIFQPWQIWWPLGDLDHVVRGGDGLIKVDYRHPDAWISTIARPTILLVALGLSALWYRRRRSLRPSDALLLLALVMLARCVLDPWNIGYYHVPFLFALLAWEATTRTGPPVASLSAAAAIWFTFSAAPTWLSPDAQSLLYLAWALPCAGALAVVAFRLPVHGWRSRVVQA